VNPGMRAAHAHVGSGGGCQTNSGDGDEQE
jgi:hypothetical protein